MSIYRDHVLPRLMDKACGTAELTRWRRSVTAGLSGTVVEIGFGSGLNLRAYPPEVQVVLAVEPAAASRRLAEDRISDSHLEVRHVALRGESLPLDDNSCDGALSTFTLCTIVDVNAALGEIRRVVRPGGRFHFLEHGLSPDDSVARWQRRIDPVQSRVADGCHLTRDIAELVRAAGFEIEHIESRYGEGPKPWTWMTEGRVINPA